MRYDDIYRMDEIKSLSFHIMFYRLYRGVAKYIVYGNSLFIIWVTAIFIRRPPRGEKERQNEQPGQNEELVTKRGTTSVAWLRVFKYYSFKTTDFKPLKRKQQT